MIFSFDPMTPSCIALSPSWLRAHHSISFRCFLHFYPVSTSSSSLSLLSIFPFKHFCLSSASQFCIFTNTFLRHYLLTLAFDGDNSFSFCLSVILSYYFISVSFLSHKFYIIFFGFASLRWKYDYSLLSVLSLLPCCFPSSVNCNFTFTLKNYISSYFLFTKYYSVFFVLSKVNP